MSKWGISDGEYKVGPGTLYDNLRTLLRAGLVTDFSEQGDAAEPRRLYHLTESGAQVLDSELKRLSGVVRAGIKRLSSGRIREAQ